MNVSVKELPYNRPVGMITLKAGNMRAPIRQIVRDFLNASREGFSNFFSIRHSDDYYEARRDDVCRHAEERISELAEKSVLEADRIIFSKKNHFKDGCDLK